MRSQLVQVQKPGVQLPQTPLPLNSAQQQQQQRRVVPQQAQQQQVQQSQQPQQQQLQLLQTQPQAQQQAQPVTKQIMVTTTTANGQPQQLIIQSQNPNVILNKGMVLTSAQPQQAIRSQAPPQLTQQPQQPPQPQPLQAPQLMQQQRPQTPLQLQQQQQQQQSQQQNQQQPLNPNQPQQVQLRVSNDEINRQFCLSWLKATYESVNGSSIEQQVMYKQYLASLHKLGKKDVISAQHYAVCVRCV